MAASFPSLDKTPRAFPLPTISEDTLDYAIYLPESAEVDAESFATLISDYVQSLLIQPWLWHKDTWELKVSSSTGGSGTSKAKGNERQLVGRMRVGDSVDDEWLVVWLLKQVSMKWKDLVISIRDTDGEFLLIEAANELPSWVSPDNADNRLWLSNGHIHLIHLQIRSSTSSIPRRIADDEEGERAFDPETYLSPEDGVKAVRTGKYRAENKVEESIWSRVKQYPGGMRGHIHCTKAYLPLPIAQALSSHPELVQRAVEGFYVRDPAQLRAAAKMTHFPPSTSILTTVLMTRPAYAQLQGQVFHPPRVFGPEWTVADGSELENERKWRDLGIKIATGFEIMYREGGKKGRSGDVSTDQSVRDDPDYGRYLADLKKAGWFGDEMEGSAAWKERDEKAMKGWKEVRSSDVAQQRPSFAYQVDNAIATCKVDQTWLEVDEDTPEDSDSWLEIAPDELDALLQKVSGLSAAPKAEEAGQAAINVDDEDGKALQDMAQKVKKFIGGQGDMVGARFADELSDEDMDGASDVSGDDEDDEPNMTVEEREARMSKLVPELPAEEWGDKNTTNYSTLAKAPATNGSKIPQEPIKMRPPLFAKAEYDGAVSDSDDSEDDEDSANLPPAGTLGKKIADMKWAEGEDRSSRIEEIEEAEEEDRKKQIDWQDVSDEVMKQRVLEEDRPKSKRKEAVTGIEDAEIDPDFEEEFDGFLKFSREALGIDDDMWKEMMQSREARGAFVPKPSTKHSQDPEMGSSPPKKVKFATKPEVVEPPTQAPSDGQVNMSLNSFDRVMEAMDAELAKVKPTNPSSKPKKSKSKKPPVIPKLQPGKGRANPANALPPLPTEEDLDALSEDDLLAMDRELREALRSAGIEDDSDDEMQGEDDPDDAKDLQGDDRMEYKMMKDFLESFKSQGGQAGAVGNLFGRLGEKK